MTINPLYAEAKKYVSHEQDLLIDDIQNIFNHLSQDQVNDYSFIVAPAAKAYEGYLKDFFLELKIIDRYSYESDRFRVGKTLNPSLRYKRFSIFKKLAELHEDGELLAEKLWTAWKLGRNEIFHYFPGNVKKLTRSEAEERVNLILKAIIESGNFVDKYQQYLLL
jgi:hypothetical protein